MLFVEFAGGYWRIARADLQSVLKRPLQNRVASLAPRYEPQKRIPDSFVAFSAKQRHPFE